MEESDEKEDNLLVLHRKEMLSCICQGRNCKDIMNNVIRMEVSTFTKKYAMLNVKEFLMKNKEGYERILELLGYKERCETGLTFAPDMHVNILMVANLIVDMLFFKTEITEYLRGNHPCEQEIKAFLSAEAIDEVLAFRASLRSAQDREDSLSSSDENPCEGDQEQIGLPIGQEPVAACANGNNNAPELTIKTSEPSQDQTSGHPSPVIKSKLVMGEVERASQNLAEVSASHSFLTASSGNQSSSGHLISCDVCGLEAQAFCRECSKKPFCLSCADSFHRHPNRRNHQVEPITNPADVSLDSQPKIQIEGAYGISAQAQNQTSAAARQKLNESQETAVVKSPSKGMKYASNVPKFGLLGINTQDSGPDQLNNHPHQLGGSHHFHQTSNTSQQPSQAMNRLQYLHQINSSPMHGPPDSFYPKELQPGDIIPMPPPVHPYHPNLRTSTPLPSPYPMIPLGPSSYRGDVAIEAQHPPFLGHPYSDAQMDFNSAKIRMGQNPEGVMLPSHGPPLTASHNNPLFTHQTPKVVQRPPPMENVPIHSSSPGSTMSHQMPKAGDVELTSMMAGGGHPMGPLSSHHLHQSGNRWSMSQPSGIISMAGNNSNRHPTREYPSSLYFSASNSLQSSKHPLDHPPPKSMMMDNFINGEQQSPGNSNIQSEMVVSGYPDHKSIPLASGQYSNHPGVRPQTQTHLPSDHQHSPMSSPPYISSRIENILREVDLMRRKKLCLDTIRELDQSLGELDRTISRLLHQEENLNKNENLSQIYSMKTSCMKEKIWLETYLKHLDSEIERQKPESFLPHSSMIRFPPTTTNIIKATAQPGSSHENINVSGFRSAYSEKQGESLLVINERKSVQLATMSPKDSQLMPAAVAERVSSTCAQRREPVESSNSFEEPIRPFLPPRPERESPEPENILQQTVPAPPPSLWKTEKSNLRWQCEHCTLINEPDSHICSACDRTSDHRKLVPESPQPPDSETEMETRDPLIDLLTETFSESKNESGTQESFGDEDFAFMPSSRRRIIESQEEVMKEKKMAHQSLSSELPIDPQAGSQLASFPVTSTAVSAGDDNDNSNEQGGQGEGLEDVQLSEVVMPSQRVPSPHVVGQSKGAEGAVPKETEEDAREAIARKNEVEHCNHMTQEGLELLALVKDADFRGFNPDVVAIALHSSKSLTMDPLRWLEENWFTYCEKVSAQVLMEGSAEAENCVGELSLEEAQEALVESHGNVQEAVKLAIGRRKELFSKLDSRGVFPREEILSVMKLCKGHAAAAEMNLIRSVLQPFVDRIWDPTKAEGTENLAVYACAQAGLYNNFSISIITHDDFQKIVKNKDVDKELQGRNSQMKARKSHMRVGRLSSCKRGLNRQSRRIRMVLVEGRMKSWGRAQMVVDLLDDDPVICQLALDDVVEAVSNCQSRNDAIANLQQECLLCFDKFPMSKIRTLNVCQCKMCEDCLVQNFRYTIRERHIRYWTCPLCSLPDISDDEITTNYLQFLCLQLQPLLGRELMDTFEVKVRDLHLQKDPNFIWCAHCANGFLVENPNHLRIVCPSCQKYTCRQCRKEWEDQHTGLTCEEFAAWKIDNDPTNQAVGLAKHLEENGIDCPDCKMRFCLAKGGCMHFHCPQCGFEFCSGCNEKYHKAGMCTKYQTCHTLGLHCHHPRDCYSYLRDNSVAELKTLLQYHKVDFNEETPGDQEDASLCPVMEQKEFGAHKKDEQCGRGSEQGQAGLCECHYKEYLTGKINSNRLDPLLIMSTGNMVALLNRHDIRPPIRGSDEGEEEFKDKLSNIILQKLPLKRR